MKYLRSRQLLISVLLSLSVRYTGLFSWSPLGLMTFTRGVGGSIKAQEGRRALAFSPETPHGSPRTPFCLATSSSAQTVA